MPLQVVRCHPSHNSTHASMRFAGRLRAHRRTSAHKCLVMLLLAERWLEIEAVQAEARQARERSSAVDLSSCPTRLRQALMSVYLCVHVYTHVCQCGNAWSHRVCVGCTCSAWRFEMIVSSVSKCKERAVSCRSQIRSSRERGPPPWNESKNIGISSRFK